MNFIDCIAQLEKRFKKPLPGWHAQSRMAPASRKSNDEYKELTRDPVKSSVLVLLYPAKDETFFLLIERTDGGVHSRQVGFPGGKYETADGNLRNTALRESEEETGISRKGVKVLGTLSDLYIPASGYRVFPQVGFMEDHPVFKPNPSEVKNIIEAELKTFLAGGLVKKDTFKTSYGLHEAPYYDYKGYRVWGATSMILSEFICMLE